MAKANVNKSKCLGCAACTSVCPTGAITIDSDGKAIVDESKCIGCGACAATCTAGTIKLK